jgi:multidrug resistance efflux pump
MRRLIVPLILILAVFGWLIYRGEHKKQDNVYSGMIEARDADIGSLMGGRVSEVLVQEGDSVKAGQAIVRFDRYILDPQVKEQESRVAQMKANLERVQRGPRSEEVARAKIAWQQAESERVREEGLLKQGVTAQAAYDVAAAKANTAKEQYDELSRGSRREDIAQAKAQLAAEESALAMLHRQVEESEVRAPADGVIQTMDLRPGDMVAPNQAVAVLLESNELWVRVYVPETRLGNVKVGQPVDVSIDTFPKRFFKSKVQSISERAEYTPRNVQTPEQREDQVFAVRLHLDPAPELKAGMTATVRFE